MRVKKTIITAAILMVAVCLPAQNKSAGINLSIWKGVGTQPLDSTQTTFVNIGLQSTMNRLNGIGINALGGVVRKDMNGIQLSGIVNIVGGSMRGIQFSGISNINGNSMSGFSAAGLVNIAGNRAKGVILSGLTNITGNNTTGLSISGCMNITGNQASGVQLSSLANIAGREFGGVMASGFLNVVGEDINGLQISGIGNIAARNMNGAQIGMCNFTTRGHGIQIGLINYYKEEMKGFQLGLVNTNPRTKVQIMMYGGNSTLINVGARFKNDLFYTILGVGTMNQNLNDKFSIAASYRAGLSIPLYKGFSISGDLGYQHIETLKNKNESTPQRLYALQGRINLEYQLTKSLGFFATGGYEFTKYYNQSQNFDKGMILEAGVTLFP